MTDNVTKKEQFTIIYREHYPKVFRLCKGYFNGDEDPANDTVQEIFIKVWQNLDSFRNESSISTWIYRIAVNCCLLYKRKPYLRKEIHLQKMPVVVQEDYDPVMEERMQNMYRFCWYSLIYVGIQFSWFHFGLALMFLSLLVRLIAEYRSYNSLRSMDIRIDLMHYAKWITQFYSNRKKIHYVITPITVALYVSGFIFLLPVLEESLSTGFFWYIVISGCILLILFAVMIIWQIKQEVQMLKFLKKIALQSS